MQYNGTVRDNVFVCRGQQPRLARDLEHFFSITVAEILI